MRKKVDLNFVDDDPSKVPQPVNWKWDADDGLPEWDGRLDETNNSDEDGGGIYGYSDDEEVSNLNVSIDMIVDNGKPMKKRLRRSLRRLWEEPVRLQKKILEKEKLLNRIL